MTHATSRAMRSLTAAAAISSAAFLVACGGDNRVDRGSGGTMVVVTPAEPNHLFPPTESTTQALMVISQVFDRLALVGDDLETRGDRGFTPALASSWEWAPDSMSIAFTIDAAARWHDGTPVTSEDVRYSFRTYNSDHYIASARPLLGNIDSVSVPNARTATFWFKRRTPQQFFDATYHMFILPSHLLSQLPDSTIARSDFARHPVGSGRFRFVRWDEKQRIELIADTANYRGRAQLDRVIFSFASDAGAAAVRLFSGDADFYEAIGPQHLDQVARTAELRLVRLPTLQYQYLGFNLRDPRNRERPHPVFSDRAVRRALVLATDRDRLTQSIFDSMATTAVGPAPRALIADTTAFTRPAFSLERATALLDSAGWVDRDGDGIRERDGVRLSFEVLAIQSSTPRQRAATQLMEQYRRVGAELRPVVVDVGVIQERLKSGAFDAWMGGWVPTPGLRGMPGAWGTGGSQNYQRYSNPQVDAALEEALSTFDDARSRAAIARAMQIMWDDAPSVWLFDLQNPGAMHRRLQPAPLRADGWYVNLADWTIDPAQRIERDRIGLTEAAR